MASKSGMFCKVCGKQLDNPNYFAFADDGTIETMCDECYNDIERFYVKGANNDGPRTTDSRDKSKV